MEIDSRRLLNYQVKTLIFREKTSAWNTLFAALDLWAVPTLTGQSLDPIIKSLRYSLSDFPSYSFAAFYDLTILEYETRSGPRIWFCRVLSTLVEHSFDPELYARGLSGSRGREPFILNPEYSFFFTNTRYLCLYPYISLYFIIYFRHKTGIFA